MKKRLTRPNGRLGTPNFLPGRAVLLLAAMLLGGCTYIGIDLDNNNPIVRKFTWFSYLAGDDIRAACGFNAPAAYRFVYNGVYTEQVRAYDLRPGKEEGQYDLIARVTGEANLGDLTTDFNRPDLLKPWRAIESIARIDEEKALKIGKTIVSDKNLASEPSEADFSSIEFYWTVAACHDGKFLFNAVKWPSREFVDVGLWQQLSPWDKTDIPINRPRKTSLFAIYGTTDTEEHHNVFTLKMKRIGLFDFLTEN